MSKNDITGDRLVSKANSKAFDENFDKIFGKKATVEATANVQHLVRDTSQRMYDSMKICGRCNIEREEIIAGQVYRCPMCDSEAHVG